MYAMTDHHWFQCRILYFPADNDTDTRYTLSSCFPIFPVTLIRDDQCSSGHPADAVFSLIVLLLL